MSKTTYTLLDGTEVITGDLDAEERQLLARLKRQAKDQPDWDDFENYWTRAVSRFYDQRGLSRLQSKRTAVYRIAQDLGNRLAVRSGQARLPDYRDELEAIIRNQFGTRRAFCEATGLSETLLSHALARRKQIAIDTLTGALRRIGYEIRITPAAEQPC